MVVGGSEGNEKEDESRGRSSPRLDDVDEVGGSPKRFTVPAAKPARVVYACIKGKTGELILAIL